MLPMPNATIPGATRSRLFVTRHEVQQTAAVLRSSAGTLAVHEGAVSVVDAIATAAARLSAAVQAPVVAPLTDGKVFEVAA